MHFGGYDEDLVKSYYNETFKENKTVDELVTWMELTSQQYWQVKLNKVQIGGENFTLTSTNAVFDSGSSLTYIPSKDYTTLKDALIPSGVSCQKNN